MHFGHQERRDKLETSDAHEARDLTHGDIDGRASHETGDGGYRDQLHYPAKAEQSDPQDDETAYERGIYGDFGARIFVGVLMVNICNNLRDLKRHDGDWADGNILGCGKKLKGRLSMK